MVAGVTLRLDGMYDEAMEQFNRSLRLNPSNAPVIYQPSPRGYINISESAEAWPTRRSCRRDSSLEPRHPLLLTSVAYQHMRRGRYVGTRSETLEGVIRDDPSMRIAYPTLAICYVQIGNQEARGFA